MKRLHGGLRLLPDQVVEATWRGEQVRLVLDAKHDEHDRWPDTASLTKQMLCRFFLSDRYSHGGFPFDRMGNAFLAATVSEGADVVVLGVHDLQQESSLASPFGRVVVVGVSYELGPSTYTRAGELRN